MNLSQSIHRTPIPYDIDRGRELADAFAAKGDFGELLQGVGGCSPFLFDTLSRHVDWFWHCWGADDPLTRILSCELDVATVAMALREAKQKVVGYLAMLELSGAAPLMDTTRLLTEFADYTVQTAFDAAMAPYKAGGKLPADPHLFVLAMGKMGAYELNFSSDIDLIVMFDDRDMDVVEAGMLRQVLTRATRAAVKILNDVTANGYVFRTDLRLRPDPSVTPICVGMSSALEYYESLGRTWERAAFIKARVCAGDHKAGEEFLTLMRPFVWRRHLDFAAIQEAHDLRLKIRKKTGGKAQISLPGHDIKLGAGGVREIEFFTQTRQLIAGGRDERLRGTQTLSSLDMLFSADWIDAPTCDVLKEKYVQLRHVEHALQMVRDAQTQSLPHSDEGMARIAALRGQSLSEFQTQTLESLETVNDLAERFFAPAKCQVDTIEMVGHDDITSQWPTYSALRSGRATDLFVQLRPEILQNLAQASNPREALLNFDAFLKGLPAGIQVFSLFASNPKLVKLITDIAAFAPALSQFLGRNSDVLDAVLSGEFFADWASEPALYTEVSHRLDQATDYEAGLISARIWAKEEHFRIGVHLLLGLISPDQASGHYAMLARVIATTILEFASQEFEKKFGKIEGSQHLILAMGSLGAGALTSTSDLDVILIFEADVGETSDGRKSLPARQYFSRLTQAFITALTAQMPSGRLYEVDMRLRPSGRAGPVATSLTSFTDYQMNDAWTWEHLALTRASVLGTETPLENAVRAARCKIIEAKADWECTRDAIIDMRRRLAADMPTTGEWDLKRGEGGLQDIELTAQGIALSISCLATTTADQLSAGVASGQFDAAAVADLVEAHRFMSSLRMLHILMCSSESGTVELGIGARNRMMSLMNLSDDVKIEDKILHTKSQAAKAINTLLAAKES